MEELVAVIGFYVHIQTGELFWCFWGKKVHANDADQSRLS